MKTLQFILCALLAILLVDGETSSALTTNWTNASGGSWHTPGNWSNGVPTTADTANITLAGTYTVSITSAATVEVLRLGAVSGVQTLDVDQNLYTFEGFGGSIIIFANGVFDASDSVGFYSEFTNSGTVILRNGGKCIALYCDPCPTFTNNAVMQMQAGSALVGSELTLENWGTLTADNADLGYSVVDRDSVYISGTCRVSYLNMTSNTDLVIAPEDTLRVGLNGSTTGGINNSTNSRIWMGGASHIRADWSILPPFFYNDGIITAQADVNPANGPTTLDVDFTQDDGAAVLNVLVDKFQIPRPCNLGDSVYVAAGCTLVVQNADFGAPPNTVAGSGTIMSLAGTGNWGGEWYFDGSIYLLGSGPTGAVVNFDPSPSPIVQLRSLNIGTATNADSFMISSSDTLRVDSLLQYAGRVAGDVIVTAVYNWNWGTATSSGASELLILPGVLMTVSGNFMKTLDSLELIVQGTAVMQDSGLFRLLDSAVVNIAPDGVLSVGAKFRMSGVGKLYNSGQSSFNAGAGADSIRINVPVFNSTVARTPGTIDILSRRVGFSTGGGNDAGGTMTLQEDSELILGGTFSNSGTMTVNDSAALVVNDTLINSSSGSIEILGGGAIGGDGVVENGGNITGGGSLFASITNVNVSPELINLDDSGFVNVLVDTLTLLGGGINQGTITIPVGKVLKVYGTFLNDVTGIITGGGVLNVTDAVFTNNGTISPGSSPGLLTVNGNMAMGAASRLNMEMNGPSLVQYDRIQVNGTVTAGGTLSLLRQPGYLPSMTDTLRLINYNGHAGLFNTVTGTPIGDGRFFEVALGPTGLVNYVCNGVSNCSPSVSSVSDTIVQTITPVDTVVFTICNTGHCPLEYDIQPVQLSPQNPTWLTTVPGYEVGLLTRTNCAQVKLRVNTTGFPPGTYTAEVLVNSNDPGDQTITIPLTYIVQRGPDIWDVGGGANHFPTIAAAVTYLNSGPIQYPQIFNVYGLTYTSTGTITVNANTGSSPTNTVTFRRAVPNGTTPQINSTFSPILRLNGMDYLTWDGIDIRRTNTGTYNCLQLDLGADDNTFKNFAVHGLDSSNSATRAVYIVRPTNMNEACDRNTFENLHIHGCGRGFQFSSTGGGTPSCAGNKIKNCWIQHAIFSIEFRYQASLRLEGNLIEPGFSGLFGTMYAISAQSANPGDSLFIYGNSILNLTGTSNAIGMFIQPSDATAFVRVYNNVIAGWSGFTSQCRGLYLSGPTPMIVDYNSVYMTELPGGPFRVDAVEILSFNANVTMRNNLLVCDVTSDTARSLRVNATANYIGDYNCFYGTGANYQVVTRGTGSYATMALWQAATTQDQHSISDVPGFVAPNNLHIDGYWNTCDSNATPIPGITTDMDGQPRNASFPDIGADEFTGIYDNVDSLVVRRVSGTHNVRLDWEASPGAASYKIYADSTSNLSLTTAPLLGTSVTNTYTHTGAVTNPASTVKYYYLIRPSTIP